MKKIITSITLLIFLMVIVGCSNNFANKNYADDEKIISEYNTFGVNSVDQIITDQHFVCEAEFDGMELIWSYDAEQDEDIDISYLLNVTKGKAKLVYISPDDTIETLVEKTSDSADEQIENPFHLQKGTNRIKLVTTKGTSLEFDITIPVGEFYELGF